MERTTPHTEPIPRATAKVEEGIFIGLTGRTTSVWDLLPRSEKAMLDAKFRVYAKTAAMTRSNLEVRG